MQPPSETSMCHLTLLCGMFFSMNLRQFEINAEAGRCLLQDELGLELAQATASSKLWIEHKLNRKTHVEEGGRQPS